MGLGSTMKRATVKDIATELNISLGTVSKALTGKTGISEETRTMVMDTAKRLGYRVNRLAQSLARNPIVIGIIFPKVWPEFYGYLGQGIQNVLEKMRDYNVIGKYKGISSLFSGDEIRSALDSFIAEGVNAVILCPASVTSCGIYLNKLYENNIPVVILGTDLPDGQRLTCVRVDACMAGRLAGEFMNWVVPENKSIAVFIGNKGMKDHGEKVEGFLQEMQNSTLKICGIYETQDEPEVAYHLTKKIIREIPDLAGIYVATGNSIAVCKCIVEHNLEGKIRIIGTDIFPDIKKYVDDGVINGVIFQNPIKQGELSVRTIYAYLAEGTKCEDNIYVQPQLILRNNITNYL
jgi:LacI family transcriptional regulator